jgi:hypothetical protein
LADDFQGRLLPGERIVWTGVPATGLLFTARDAFLIPFSLLWGGFAVFWEWQVANSAKEPPFMLLFGAFFVAMGLYVIVGRFVIDAWVRAGMSYAVTTQRILILRTGPFAKFVSLAIDRLPELSLDERANGRGTIRFQASAPAWGYNNRFSNWTPALDPTPQFLMITDARSVFDRIQRQARNP